MSYLHLPALNLADINKGTISLWFRFSQDSVDKAAVYQSPKFHPDAPGIFDSTIPLVTFGRKVMAHVYDSQGVQVGFQPEGHDPVTGEPIGGPIIEPQVYVVGDGPCSPSHIGIACVGGSPTLVMKFQTATRAFVQGLHYQIIEAHYDYPIGSHNLQYYDTVEDVSYIEVGEPESFRIEPQFNVDVDTWHHLLVSFDFSGSVDVVAFEGDLATEEELRDQTIKSYCKLWYAFDDENKTGKENLGRPIPVDSWEGWVARDENGIVPVNADSGAISTYATHPPDVDSAGNPVRTGGGAVKEYHWTTSAIPTSGGPMGFPASAEYVDTIYHCELAEFQFFGGLVLDTADVNKRRMFVDADGKPVPPDKTQELLNRRPDILLHGSGNWQRGHNTGTTGVEIDTDGTATDLPAGQFTPVAGINKYKPEPAL